MSLGAIPPPLFTLVLQDTQTGHLAYVELKVIIKSALRCVESTLLGNTSGNLIPQKSEQLGDLKFRFLLVFVVYTNMCKLNRFRKKYFL